MTLLETNGAFAISERPSSKGANPHRSNQRTLAGLLLVAATVVVALLMLIPSTSLVVGPTVAKSAPLMPNGVPGSILTPGAQGPAPSSGARVAASNVFNPPCFPITKFACIRVQSPSEPDVIPTGNNHSASVEPAASDNLAFYVFSEKNLVWATTGVQTYGNNVPIALNVTGVLWNGDPYMCVCDGSVWHANNNTWYSANTGLTDSNATYPYVYNLYIVNRSAGSGAGPQFFPGETITWWIYTTNYTAATGYTHNQSVPLRYRISGAWAFSPYPGSGQYVGPNASTGDLNIRWSPRAPNWNDSVNVSISITAPDAVTKTAIGLATLYIEDVRLGRIVGNVTQRAFPIGSFTNASGILIKGNDTTNTTIPASFDQVAGDQIVFWVVAQDNARSQNDNITLPDQSYIVNGNGSFSAGIFSDDVEVATNPSDIAAANVSSPVVSPGENITVTVESRNPTTSLFNSVIVYTVHYPTLSETVSSVLQLDRLNSTAFRGMIPWMPLNVSVNFTVFAFDYNFRLDQSSPYPFHTPSLSNYVALLPTNDSFFYVYVYNNGSATYVSGATVQIRGPSPGFNTLSQTAYGIAYPNSTKDNFLPLLVPANAAYNITLTTPQVTANGGAHEVSVVVLATNSMNAHQTLAHGSSYIVVQEGNSIYFWINGSVPATVYSPGAGSTGIGTLFAVSAFAGLIAAAVCSYFLYKWFDRILKRRKAEERRVTL